MGAAKHQSPYDELNDEKWVRSHYVDNFMTMEEMAAEVGCSRQAVRNALTRHGIDVRPQNSRYRELHDRDWMNKQWVEKDRSAADMAGEIGCSIKSVYAALRRHELN